MKRIGLLRYHNQAEMCINRLKLFHHFNPEVPVYGLFGGKEEEFSMYDDQLKDHLAGNYCLRNVSDEWKWRNGDLAFRLWYKDFGCHLDFQMVHILEWDLLMFDSLDSLYSHIPKNGLGVTGLTPLKKIYKKWFWTRNQEQQAEWEELYQFVHDTFSIAEPPFASAGPGLALPKSFLERYTRISVPELSHDELRIPLFAQAFGYPLYNTGFYRKWFSEKEWKYFNCNAFDISWSTIQKELHNKKGRRVFHPYRDLINLETISAENQQYPYGT